MKNKTYLTFVFISIFTLSASWADDLIYAPSKAKRASEKVFFPKKFKQKKKWPLVIMLHGFTGNATGHLFYTGLGARVNKDGFILVAPEGVKNQFGEQFWAADEFCCDWYNKGVDDLSYLTNLIDHYIENYRVDPKSVYIVGHSNGGFMAYSLACQSDSKVAGIAVISGSSTLRSTECKNKSPFSLLHIHGTSDTTIEYSPTQLFTDSLVSIFGQRFKNVDKNRSPYLGGRQLVTSYAAKFGCNEVPTEFKNLYNFTLGAKFKETDVSSWAGCQEGSKVELWLMDQAPHSPLFHFRFKRKLIEFLFQFKLP
ncbi:MAG: prolyl oligopeptidase family serine peptidase [Bacteriovoracaceae bacterium]|jgi:polyhydroxybutyrate depolymerase|nr:prolyl oligopeptidase family serine peptidase [Bacteriovoracaceae bacterium]